MEAVVFHGIGTIRVDDVPEPVMQVPAKFDGPFEMVGLAGVGHFPQREAPAAVADLLVAFLDGTRP